MHCNVNTTTVCHAIELRFFKKARRNPYAAKLKRRVTIRLDKATIRYFKHLSGQTGIAYQTLINLYLRDCAVGQRKLKWA
jgi:predicted DNA binding CopG/RHH family protein